MKNIYLSSLNIDSKNKKILVLTSDIWSDIQMKSYLGVTIHFLENNTFVSGNI